MEQSPPQRSWWSRNWKWALPVGCVLPISGPKGSGTLSIVGTRSAGRWQYSTMAVEVPGRASRIDVRPRSP